MNRGLQMNIKIEKSKNKFIKRISINSEELNLSINIMNCKYKEIKKIYFRHFNFEEFKDQFLIKLICDDQLLYETLAAYLSQKNPILLSSNKNYQTVLQIKSYEKYVKIEINNYIAEISKPIGFEISAIQLFISILTYFS